MYKHKQRNIRIPINFLIAFPLFLLLENLDKLFSIQLTFTIYSKLPNRNMQTYPPISYSNEIKYEAQSLDRQLFIFLPVFITISLRALINYSRCILNYLKFYKVYVFSRNIYFSDNSICHLQLTELIYVHYLFIYF